MQKINTSSILFLLFFLSYGALFGHELTNSFLRKRSQVLHMFNTMMQRGEYPEIIFDPVQCLYTYKHYTLLVRFAALNVEDAVAQYNCTADQLTIIINKNMLEKCNIQDFEFAIRHELGHVYDTLRIQQSEYIVDTLPDASLKAVVKFFMRYLHEHAADKHALFHPGMSKSTLNYLKEVKLCSANRSFCAVPPHDDNYLKLALFVDADHFFRQCVAVIDGATVNYWGHAHSVLLYCWVKKSLMLKNQESIYHQSGALDSKGHVNLFNELYFFHDYIKNHLFVFSYEQRMVKYFLTEQFRALLYVGGYSDYIIG